MRISKKSVAIAVLTLGFFTVLPIALQWTVPSEFFRAFSTQGFDLADLLNKIALIGLAMAALGLLKGSADKASSTYLALSVTSKVFWLVLTFFAMGLGRIESFGLAEVSSQAGGASNTVVFDPRLFAYLAVIIVVLKIALSVLGFQETRPQPMQTQQLRQKSNSQNIPGSGSKEN